MNMPTKNRKANYFEIFPAIDLRAGQVVRLLQGDPTRQTIYAYEPASVAKHWISTGARWLHVVNLDGAFGEKSAQNLKALENIVQVARVKGAQIQFGGGIRTAQDAARLFNIGVNRIVLGTLAVSKPDLVSELIAQYGVAQVAVGLDAKNGEIYTHGWTESTNLQVLTAAANLKALGLEWLIYTDILRDGMQTGLALDNTTELQKESALKVIASGGVSSLEDVQQAKKLGLAGVIVGKALYEDKLDPEELFDLNK